MMCMRKSVSLEVGMRIVKLMDTISAGIVVMVM